MASADSSSLRPGMRRIAGVLLTTALTTAVSAFGHGMVSRAAASAPSFAAVSGTYVGGTADAGSLYVAADGSARFLAPDGAGCPACTTAGSPVGSIDFRLRSSSSTRKGAYRATGVITTTSDAPWAAAFPGRPKPGSPVSLTISKTRRLTLSFLGANDVLSFSSRAAVYSNTPACTVAAVSGPVRAYGSGTKVDGVTCAPDRQWAAASVSTRAYDEVIVLEADFTHWAVVDRPTVCNHHHVPANFFKAACGSD